MKLSKIFGVIACCVTSVASYVPASAQGKQISLALDSSDPISQAPWRLAIAKRYYEEEGLTIDIVPVHGASRVPRAMENGSASVGFVDIPTLLALGRGPHPVKIIAVVHQRPDYVVLRVGVEAANAIESQSLGGNQGLPTVYRSFLRIDGFSRASLSIVDLDLGVFFLSSVLSVNRLTSKMLEAEFGTQRVPSSDVKYIPLPDYGLDLLSSGIAVRDQFLQTNQDLIKSFVRASLRGWRDTINNPGEAAQILSETFPALDRSLTQKQIERSRRRILIGSTRTHGIGWVDQGRAKATVDVINKLVTAPREQYQATQLFISGFLPSAPEPP